MSFAARATDAAAALRARANPDGGFAPTLGSSEPEPTAVAALALAGRTQERLAGAPAKTRLRVRNNTERAELARAGKGPD